MMARAMLLAIVVFLCDATTQSGAAATDLLPRVHHPPGRVLQVTEEHRGHAALRLTHLTPIWAPEDRPEPVLAVSDDQHGPDAHHLPREERAKPVMLGGDDSPGRVLPVTEDHRGPAPRLPLQETHPGNPTGQKTSTQPKHAALGSDAGSQRAPLHDDRRVPPAGPLLPVTDSPRGPAALLRVHDGLLGDRTEPGDVTTRCNVFSGPELPAIRDLLGSAAHLLRHEKPEKPEDRKVVTEHRGEADSPGPLLPVTEDPRRPAALPRLHDAPHGDRNEPGDETARCSCEAALLPLPGGQDHPGQELPAHRDSPRPAALPLRHQKSRGPEDQDVTTLTQAYTVLLASAVPAVAFEEAFDGELAPDYFWDLVDMGGDLCRGGIKVTDLQHEFIERARLRQDSQPQYYLDTEPIRNRLLRAWEIVCGHYFTCDLPLPPGLDANEFGRLAEQELRDQWHRQQRELPLPPVSTRTARASRSRSPAQRSRDKATASTDPDEEDITALVADRWLLKPKATHLKRTTPRRTTTETVVLRAPWRRGGNPPLRPAARPAQPAFPPPRPVRAEECAIDLEEPKDEQAEVEEVVVETNSSERDAAVEVWQALFEFEPRESLDPAAVPLVPQSILDNVVETLLDKPDAEYHQMLMTATYFLARIGEDLHQAMERAKALRARIRGEPSSSRDLPPPDESSLMQKTIHETIEPKHHILGMLRDALAALSPGASVARARRLRSRLRDHEGHLEVDRAALDAALLVYEQGDAEEATGDRYICQYAWITHWWSVLQGRTEPGHVNQDLEVLEHVCPENPDDALDPLLAEQLAYEKEEENYQRGLEEAIEHHMAQAGAEEAKDKANTEPNTENVEAPGVPSADTPAGVNSPGRDYTWTPPTKRLCVGICFTDGQQSKAWDYELDDGGQLDLHIRAQRRVLPGYWSFRGQPVPYENLPPDLQRSFRGTTTGASSSHEAPPTSLPPASFSLDLGKPATKELYERWRRGIIGDYAIRDVGGDTFLQFFRACSCISEETMTELDGIDTLPSNPAEADTLPMPGATQLDGDAVPNPGEGDAPQLGPVLPAAAMGTTPSTTTTSTSSSSSAMSASCQWEDFYHPDPYYNGAEYWRVNGPGSPDRPEP